MSRSRSHSVRSTTLPSIEQLDSRQLMSVTVPPGFVPVQTLTFDASSTAAQSIDVVAGRDYFFKATGAYEDSSSTGLRADAAGWEAYTNTWSDGIRLKVTSSGTDVASWGHHASDSEYCASYHADASGTLSAFLADSNTSDNTGTLTLTVYGRPRTLVMTGIEAGGSGPVAAASGSNGGVATLLVTPDGSNHATVNLTAAVSPNSTDARNMVAWAAYDASGTVLGGDTFDPGGESITLTFTNPTDAFTIRCGTDTNGNGAFDYGTEEVARTVTVQKVVPVLSVTNPSAAGASAGNRLTIAAGGWGAFEALARTVNGTNTSGSFTFSAAGGISVSTSVHSDGSYRLMVSIASGVASGSYTISITDANDSRVAPLSIYITV